MAEALPDLMDFPDEPVTSAGLEKSRNAGAWASRFGPSDSTPMQRLRHNQDIAGFIEQSNLKRLQDVQLERSTSKKAFDLFAAERRLGMDSEKTKAELRIKEQKLLHDEEMLPREIAAKEAATAASLARTKSTTEATQFKADTNKAESDATTGFIAQIRASGHKLGTPEYAAAVMDAHFNNPAAEDGFVRETWKTTRSEIDFDEALKRRRTVREQLSGDANTTVTTRLPGGVTVTDRPVVDANAKALQTRFDKYVLQRAHTTDKNAQKFLDAEISEMKGQLGGFQKGLIAPAVAPVADANKAAADWVAANPNDPRAAAIKAKLGMK